jgi:hypothetical protein
VTDDILVISLENSLSNDVYSVCFNGYKNVECINSDQDMNQWTVLSQSIFYEGLLLPNSIEFVGSSAPISQVYASSTVIQVITEYS